ncbi:hypothetical protein [Methylocystis echinoides]|uniref:Uncharacterized protein n=1 Tax=Methylocystis echinoides TaxID=29468 RepID=A0A9W6LQE5_9HYPH|nr:hypothetical protein [Methylocystis echinoides]GLI91281.1 hypothetical protein LMG27198_02730 [Methylocystis echinoides]
MTEISGQKPVAAARAWKVTTLAGAASNFHLFIFTSILFIAPNALFAAALRPVPAALVLVGCAGAVAILWRERLRSDLFRAVVDRRQLGLCLALGFAVCLLGGGGHVFLPKSDWLIRDAVLADLVREGFLALYRDAGQDYLLRAPLGMYLLPAMVGRFFGLYAAHLALLTQNAGIVGMIAYFTTTVAQVRRAPMLLLLLGFSGLDIVGVFAAEAAELAGGGAFMPVNHTEWWSQYFWPGRLQYSSLITQFFWVPNHAAPGWWFALLILLHARGAVRFPALLASFAPLLIWSPLSMLGAAPFLALFATWRWRTLLSRDVMASVAASLCFLPVAIYLVVDAGAVAHEWLILRDGFARLYPFFLLVEVPQAALVLYCFRYVATADRPVFWVALAILFILPVYSFGPYNDLMMRASIPALFLLAFHFARIVVLTRSGGGALASVASTLVLLAAATPFIEIVSALAPSYAISDCDLLTGSHKLEPGKLPTNYLARIEKVPVWLVDPAGARAPRTVVDRKCWPDHPGLDESLK